MQNDDHFCCSLEATSRFDLVESATLKTAGFHIETHITVKRQKAESSEE